MDTEPSKARKTLKNGVENGKSQEITLVDLEEELNLEELMKQKVFHPIKLFFKHKNKTLFTGVAAS